MGAFVNGFVIALLALAISTIPLWIIARSAGERLGSLVRFIATLIGVVLAYCLISLVIPPLYGRLLLFVGVWGLAATKLRRFQLCDADRDFAAILLVASLISAVLPDSQLINWDNYTHWSVILKSFDFAEPYLGNGYTKFPTYPPFHTLLVYYLQGGVPFNTANLQTYKVFLLTLLTAYVVLASAGSSAIGRLRLVTGFALLALFIALTFRLLGGFQSAYGDFSASFFIALAVIAAFDHALAPNRATYVLALLSACALALTRMGMFPVSVIVAVALVLLDWWMRRREDNPPARPPLPLYAATIAAPVICYAIYAVIMIAAYDKLQAEPSSLIASLRNIATGQNPGLLGALGDAFFFEGKPSFRGYGVSPAVFMLIGAICGAIAVYNNPHRRLIAAGFVVFMLGLMAAWSVAVSLQMDGFFRGDPTLPSYQRYLGIMLLPFLIVGFTMLLRATAPRGTLAGFAIVIAASLVLNLSLVRTQFWQPPWQDPSALRLASLVRPLVERDRVWVLSSADSGDPHFANFQYHYLLMPALTNGNACFVGVRCGEETTDGFARVLLGGGYRWVLIDSLTARERALVTPLVADYALPALRERKPALLRIVQGSATGLIELVPLDLTIKTLVEQDVPRQGVTY